VLDKLLVIYVRDRRTVVRNEIGIHILTGKFGKSGLRQYPLFCLSRTDMDVSEHKTNNLKQTQNKKIETDKYRLVEYHSFITFLYTTVNAMALIISINHISK
jgi:hypothetical protein